MPTRVVSFFHPSVVASSVALTNAFGTTKVHAHDLRSGAVPGVVSQRFRERVEGIRIRLSTVGSATKITLKVCLDALGNDIVVPDVEATIATGIDDTSKGAVAYSVKLPLYQSATGEIGKLYLFMKADNNCTVDQTTITWTET
tara:strand:+ start:251 stop:679 length:429 start_codon:yes stop_codon:yes gene_type:complete